MSNVSEDSLNKMMNYVSHPCSNIVHGDLIPRDDGKIVIKTHMKLIPTVNYHTPDVFVFRDETTNTDEEWYEADVVQRHIHNQLKTAFTSKT